MRPRHHSVNTNKHKIYRTNRSSQHHICIHNITFYNRSTLQDSILSTLEQIDQQRQCSLPNPTVTLTSRCKPLTNILRFAEIDSSFISFIHLPSISILNQTRISDSKQTRQPKDRSIQDNDSTSWGKSLGPKGRLRPDFHNHQLNTSVHNRKDIQFTGTNHEDSCDQCLRSLYLPG